MKEIKFLKDGIIIVFFNGVSVKLKGKLEYADSIHVQTREGNGFHTITIHGDAYEYEDMPFSLKR